MIVRSPQEWIFHFQPDSKVDPFLRVRFRNPIMPRTTILGT